MKSLPKSFFEKARTNVKSVKQESKKQQDKTNSFNWSHEVLNGSKKASVHLIVKH